MFEIFDSITKITSCLWYVMGRSEDVVGTRDLCIITTHEVKDLKKGIAFSGYFALGGCPCPSVPLIASLENPKLSIKKLQFFTLCSSINFNVSSPHKK